MMVEAQPLAMTRNDDKSHQLVTSEPGTRLNE
jgi:hypothetical protein